MTLGNINYFNPITGVETVYAAIDADINLNGIAVNGDLGGLIYGHRISNSSEIVVYDPALNTWATVGTVSGANFSSGAGSYYNGVLYLGDDLTAIYAITLSTDGKSIVSSSLFSSDFTGVGNGNWGDIAIGIGCNGNPTLFGSPWGERGLYTLDLTTATTTGNVGTDIGGGFPGQIAVVNGILYGNSTHPSTDLYRINVCTGVLTDTGFDLNAAPTDLGNGVSMNSCIFDIDTDMDGIVDRLDLDSDGDGCYDKIEAGVTGFTTDGSVTDSLAATTAGEVGDNGLDDDIENDDTGAATTSGSYTITQTNAGTNDFQSGIKAPACPCTVMDSDSDGICDTDDIDDDNDGILDTDEGCMYYKTETWTDLGSGVWESTNATTGVKVRITLSDYTEFWDSAPGGDGTAAFDATCTGFTSNTGVLTGTNSLTLRAAGNAGTASGANFTVSFLDGANNPVNIAFPRIHFAGIGGSNSGSGVHRTNSTSWTLLGGLALEQLSGTRLNSTSTSFVHSEVGQVAAPTGVGNCSEGEASGTIEISHSLNSFTFNVEEIGYDGLPTNAQSDRIDYIFEYQYCPDTDNDGITDNLDLDSDGDGCYDKIEAAVTGFTTDGSLTDSLAATTSAEVGMNGLDDDIESDDTGAATTSGSYTITQTNAGTNDFQDMAINSACNTSPPYAVNDTTTTNQGIAVTFNLLLNDTTTVTNVLRGDSVQIITNPTQGMATYTTADSSVTYTSTGTYSGLDSLQYRVCDTLGLCDTAWAFIEVIPNILVEFTDSIAMDDEATGGNLPTLTISGGILTAASTIEIVLNVSPGTATAGVDYTPSFGSTMTINIPAGDYTTPQIISLPLSIIDDNEAEPDETFSIDLSNPQGSSSQLMIGDADGIGNTEINHIYTIVDDDCAPSAGSILNIRNEN